MNWSDEAGVKARGLIDLLWDVLPEMGRFEMRAAEQWLIAMVREFAAWDRERQRQQALKDLTESYADLREELARLRKVAEAARCILDNGSLGFTRDRLAEALAALDAVKS